MSGLELLRALVLGSVLFLLPGGLFLRALAPRLALLSPVAIASIFQPVSLTLALGWWLVTAAGSATFAVRRAAPLHGHADDV